ncbi:BadM/Rrf2 family transcriptional regulator [Macrococcoides caseolyticum]|uniref:RrF2 family transcriptional regulator n=1 Tax=Macrococcoides caseolyticum TaxID=69966 RepID=UPI000C338E3E|nr:Rrf2 family transcriptional regulator [Macrococcus caseolyticus]PKE07887.1 BadM/Rrf2 family transcriptional regulator [Macrococcus caseolyticus]PKE24885.1 BadM/Rrf2 family transcriptional regulator [Macrococcus caseolyticus]PKE54539.1 BadM/Rrf2 family transcriptional regulator [Macrococcus caseolyticus]PKF39404.1 BadM/Rrf2 family transcriptional regulator [Macrococcus caseolyticus]STY75974.1 HTH-type transcriptional repressor NsrR [Macrococcus caseolyticus]
MKLTLYSDYSLRVLMYIARQEHRVQIDEIAKFYGISKNHLTKVVNNLATLGYIETTRGRGGGIRIKMAPEEINIGALIRKTEEHFNLVECFDRETNTCPIAGICGLQGVLGEALNAYLSVLDKYTLQDILFRKIAL